MISPEDLKKEVIKNYSLKKSQEFYIQKINEGLFEPEKHYYKKYFTKKKAKLLDIGCGTGRTTLKLKNRGFDIIGIDLTPKMIENAKKIAKEKRIKINYKIGDATNLKFKDNSFDYAIFSNQGLTSIPSKNNRIKALKEINRVLKPKGIFIFSTHQRVFKKGFYLLWIKQWLKLKLKKLNIINIKEIEFGDLFFDKEANSNEIIYKNKQFIHIPKIKEIENQLKESKFKIIEINKQFQLSKKDIRKYPPVFYICQK